MERERTPVTREKRHHPIFPLLIQVLFAGLAEQWVLELARRCHHNLGIEGNMVAVRSAGIGVQACRHQMAGNNLFCFQAERAFLDRHLSPSSLDQSRRNPIVKLTFYQAVVMKIFELISNRTVFNLSSQQNAVQSRFIARTEVLAKLALAFSLDRRMVSGQSKGGTLSWQRKPRRKSTLRSA